MRNVCWLLVIVKMVVCQHCSGGRAGRFGEDVGCILAWPGDIKRGYVTLSFRRGHCLWPVLLQTAGSHGLPRLPRSSGRPPGWQWVAWLGLSDRTLFLPPTSYPPSTGDRVVGLVRWWPPAACWLCSARVQPFCCFALHTAFTFAITTSGLCARSMAAWRVLVCSMAWFWWRVHTCFGGKTGVRARGAALISSLHLLSLPPSSLLSSLLTLSFSTHHHIASLLCCDLAAVC